MPQQRLTDRWLKSLKPPARRIEYQDTVARGLSLRVAPTGVMTWTAVYRIPGDRTWRRVTLGRYPDMPLADARAQAGEKLTAARQGHDPAVARRAIREAPTFGDVAAEYLERHASTKKSGYKDKAMLENDVLPKWRHRKAHDIRRRDVIEILDAIIDRGAPIQANRTLQVLRKLFNWAIGRDIVESNPCWQVKAPGKERRKDRVLTCDEILAFWRALEGVNMTPKLKAAFRLILITAQRPGEVLGMKREEISDDWWSIPGERAKNGLPHRVPLSPLAREIVARLPDNGYLFPSPRQDAGAIDVNALSHALRREWKHFKGVEPFTPHDLRRTAASHMTSAGIPRLVVGKILNHAEPGVTAVYDRASYDAEKRRALDKWSRRLKAMLGDGHGKVVTLGKAG